MGRVLTMLSVGATVRIARLCDNTAMPGYLGQIGKVIEIRTDGFNGDSPEDPLLVVKTPMGTQSFWGEELELLTL